MQAQAQGAGRKGHLRVGRVACSCSVVVGSLRWLGSYGTAGILRSVEELDDVERNIDEETLCRLRALERLDPKTRRTVLEVLDTFIRDASARKAYAPA